MARRNFGILAHAQDLYDDDDGRTSAMWMFLNRMIQSGEIDGDTADDIAYLVQYGDWNDHDKITKGW